jgi:L-malate glycosyltransferase
VKQPVLHQVIVGTAPGDAITAQAFAIRSWLHELGFHSEIFAKYIHQALESEVRPFVTYRPARAESFLIFHHSIGSSLVEEVAQLPLPLILVYHNITPAEFFADVDPVWKQRMLLGRQQLQRLQASTHLGLADSFYNEEELRASGYQETGVLPIVVEESEYNLPNNEGLVARYRDGGPNLLFVGKVAPHKKQEDLIKLLYYYRRIQPGARLLLVGDKWLPGYDEWLADLIANLGLQQSVVLTGRVSQQDMVTYYRIADLYVSMSEHEGFGKPLIESMYLGLPILAYASAAVPLTVGRTGLLFHQKNFEVLAELVDIVMCDPGLRARIIERQRQRVQMYLASEVRQTFLSYLAQLSLVEK